MRSRPTVLRILFKDDKQTLGRNLGCPSQKPPGTKPRPHVCLGLLAAQTLRVIAFLSKSLRQTSELIPVQEK